MRGTAVFGKEDVDREGKGDRWCNGISKNECSTGREKDDTQKLLQCERSRQGMTMNGTSSVE